MVEYSKAIIIAMVLQIEVRLKAVFAKHVGMVLLFLEFPDVHMAWMCHVDTAALLWRQFLWL